MDVSMKALSTAEISGMAAQADGWLLDAVELFRDTGIRVGELASIEAHHFDLGVKFPGDRVALRVRTLKQKGAERWRTIPVRADLARRIIRRAGEGKAFDVTPGQVRRRIKRLGRLAGVPARRSRPHAFRHAFALRSAEAGVPLPVLQRWLGHRSVANTQVYFEAIELAKWIPPEAA